MENDQASTMPEGWAETPGDAQTLWGPPMRLDQVEELLTRLPAIAKGAQHA